MQKIWADFGYVGKINEKKNKKNQCLALPKDRQSYCEVQKNVIRFFQKKIFVTNELSKYSKIQQFSKTSNWKWVQ